MRERLRKTGTAVERERLRKRESEVEKGGRKGAQQKELIGKKKGERGLPGDLFQDSQPSSVMHCVPYPDVSVTS